MKFITERTEIAQTINFHKMPVVKMDLANKTEYGIRSEKVLIDNGTFRDGNPYYIKSDLRVYEDSAKFEFSNKCGCLTDSFGYSDIAEMLEFANAPIIKADSDFCLVIIDSEKRTALKPIILHTSKRIDAHCITPLSVEEIDLEALIAKQLLEMAGFKKETTEA